MVKQIFVNLPVEDLKKSMDFFKSLGFTFNEQFTDEKAACLEIGDNIFAMLLTKPMFQGFTKKPVADAKKSTEVLLALEVESIEKVNSIVKKAVEAGGNTYMEPQDHGWMYQHGFEDLDGHQWEVFFSDISKFQQQS
ncbi:VOC family protein [Subsaxibacter sp. CAU 1640]|uniref:VOC family protein n=1 Tax=Subsaxibacter sp. CAU 1640 TaxID=2933271 RepID=UPI00200606F1|nr:VOC family protein [Subsaxibacter sp. CAU 1640]MCK7590496.1 VOC family protein [Subsaxibacter sp. CAU 1640]